MNDLLRVENLKLPTHTKTESSQIKFLQNDLHKYMLL